MLEPYKRRLPDIDAEVSGLCRSGLTCPRISDFLAKKHGGYVSEKLVQAIAQATYGKLDEFNSRPVPECPIVYLDGTWKHLRREYGGGRGGSYEGEGPMVAIGVPGKARMAR